MRDDDDLIQPMQLSRHMQTTFICSFSTVQTDSQAMFSRVSCIAQYAILQYRTSRRPFLLRHGIHSRRGVVHSKHIGILPFCLGVSLFQAWTP